jgi:hypothetical protein
MTFPCSLSAHGKFLRVDDLSGVGEMNNIFAHYRREHLNGSVIYHTYCSFAFDEL